MPKARRGELWMADLGFVAKVRPVLILSVDYRSEERAVVTYVLRTTSVRGTQYEVPHSSRGMQEGAFDAPGHRLNPRRETRTPAGCGGCCNPHQGRRRGAFLAGSLIARNWP
jgi:hypothetical protein